MNEIIKQIWKEDEIIKQIWIAVGLKEITICQTCDTIFTYTPNRRYCGKCRPYRWRNKATHQKIRANERRSQNKQRKGGGEKI